MKENILITGTSKGLGKFLKENLKNDYNIFGIARNSFKGEEKTPQDFNIDLTKFELFNNLIKIFEQEQINFDTIILNAGVGAFGKFEEVESEKYIEIINLNLLANILLLQKLEKFLNKGAKIIFIGSISSKKFFKYGAVYQASKFGLRGFAGALKNEWKDKKIFFLNPKILDTDFHKNAVVEAKNLLSLLPKFNEKQYTDMKDILQVVQNILTGREKRFEIEV